MKDGSIVMDSDICPVREFCGTGIYQNSIGEIVLLPIKVYKITYLQDGTLQYAGGMFPWVNPLFYTAKNLGQSENNFYILISIIIY